jgi:cell division septation protein DedD
MADLRDDILKEEEQYGGFTPGEPDDDTFLLQDKSYPGNNFSYINPVQSSGVAEEENHSTDEFANDDNSKQNFNKPIENDGIKKNRKKYGLIPVIAAAALLLITAAALLFMIPDKPYGIFSSNSKADDSLRLKSEKLEIDSINDTESFSKNDEIEWNDSLSQLLTHSEVVSIDTVKSLYEITDKSENIQLSENSDIDTEKKSLVDNSKHVSGKTIEQKRTPKQAETKFTEESRKIASNQTVKPNMSTSAKPHDKVATARDIDRTNITNDIAEMKPDKKVESEILREKALSETYVPKDVTGIYIVQIYSSPSREDAQAWLDKLKSNNVPDAFISEQNVRDKTWYRVRFGKYSTREEARNAALRYGFAQTWIDRVK